MTHGAVRLALQAALAGVVAAPMMGQAPRPAMDLITRNEIEIARGASAIWPHIVDPSQWKQGLRLVHRSGAAGALHEVLAAVDQDPASPAFLVETVELVPNRRRTIKLWLPDGSLIGFATWSLTENAGGNRTLVRYEVYSETRVPPADATNPDALREAERTSQLTNSKRFDAELVALKSLVERGR